MPNDRAAFARTVFATLGGRSFNRHTFAESREDAREQQAEQTCYWRFRDLAEDSLRFSGRGANAGRPCGRRRRTH